MDADCENARLANPGKLIVGMIENAVRYDQHEPGSSQFQVNRESVQDLSLKDAMEVIDLPGDAIENIEDLVAGRFRLDLAMRPTPPVMLRWCSELYGPFIASPVSDGTANGRQELVFVPANSTDMTAYRINESVFTSATRGHRIGVADEVSLTSDRRSESFQLTQVRHDLLLASGYERVLATNPQKLVLEPFEESSRGMPSSA